jgi:O-antigen/teichoic acid export membrane protein
VGLPHERLLALMRQSVRFAAWTGGFMAFAITVLAREVLTVLYGSAFAPAAASFSILAWILPTAMLSGHHRYILLAYGHQKRLLRCTAIAATIAVLLGFALVPRFRGPGAAWSLLIANVVNLILVYRSVSQLVGEVPIIRQAATPLLAVLLSAAVYFGLAGTISWRAAAAACCVYLSLLAWAEGRQAVGFLKTMMGRPAPDAA